MTPPRALPTKSSVRSHDWHCVGGADGMELWKCERCGRQAFPSPFGFMWPSLARFVPFASRWRCARQAASASSSRSLLMWSSSGMCLEDLTLQPGLSRVLDMTIDEQQAQALRDVAAAVSSAKATYDHERGRRERVIRKIAMQGATYREIAEATGLAYQRIAQIVGDKPDERPSMRDTINVPCPKCGVAAGEACEGRSTVSFHAERHDAFREAMGLE